MPIQFLPPEIEQAYQNDPRSAYAAMLLQSSQGTEPIRANSQGWAKMLSALLGGYQQAKTRSEYSKQGDEYRQMQARLLAAQQSGDENQMNAAVTQALASPYGTQLAAPIIASQYKRRTDVEDAGKKAEAEAKAKAQYEAPTERTDGAFKWEVNWQGQEIPGSRVPVQVSPGEAATQKETERYHREVERRMADQANATKTPSGYRALPDGKLEFIPGGPADPTKGAGKKAPTEDQAKNMQLYQRASQQAQILVGDGKTPGVFDALTGKGSQIGNAIGSGSPILTSQDFQRADAALKDLASSYLYSVSGATANPGEVENLTSTLRPRIGESDASIADKKARISQMVESIKTRAAGAAVSAGEPAAPAAPAAPAKVIDWHDLPD